MDEKKNHWKVIESETMYKYGYFSIRKDKCELPDGRVMPSYLTIEFGPWVHAVAVTDDGNMILVDQYRHSAKDSFLEIPGGAADKEELDDPKSAAQRELLEETGYQGDELIFLGSHYPNPALQSNQIYTYLSLNCKKVSNPKLDPYEDLSLVLMPVQEIYDLLDSGKLRHSLMIPSLVLARPHLLK
ncbi:MAG: NUDIX hydrolase [Bdellovibrionales bacterium]|nr:NUDIX hydrolase [Bdellovibrionales bacterium]